MGNECSAACNNVCKKGTGNDPNEINGDDNLTLP